MAEKSSYKDFEQKIKDLEKETIRLKRAEDPILENEERYRQLFTTVSDAIMVFDADTKDFIDANDAVVNIYGYSKEEFLKLKYTDITAEPEKSNESIIQTINGKISNIPLRYHKRKDGSIFPVEISTGAFKLADRQIIYGVVRDITIRKEAEKALRYTEQKWMSLVEHTNDFIMIIDDKGKIQYINRAIPPHTLNQAIGKTLYDFATPEHHEMIKQAVARVFETREQVSYASSVKHPTGIQWFETTMIPIVEEGKVRSAMSFNKIITKRMKAEAVLEKRNKELELKTKSLEEINTALNVLLKKRDEDKLMLEGRVLFNVKKLIEPLIETLKKSGLNENQTDYVNTLETFLAEIVSPFSQTLHNKFLGLTFSELRVANLIKQGKTTKEIAGLLDSTPRAIEFHRQSLRKKLGLTNRKVNLASHLLSFLD